MTAEERRDMFDKIKSECLLMYLFGSQIYGTATPSSDYDFICVVPDDSDLPDHVDLIGVECNIFTVSQWKEKSVRQDVDYLECIMNDDCKAIDCSDWLVVEIDMKNETTEVSSINPQFTSELDYDKIRESVSHTASNSFVKAKKKLTVEKDFAPYIAKKSLWHSLRILMFGIQIMKFGTIKDYSEANHLYDDVVNDQSNDWDHFKAKYQPIYNRLHSEFKLAHAERMKIENGRLQGIVKIRREHD